MQNHWNDSSWWTEQTRVKAKDIRNIGIATVAVFYR